MSGTLSDAAGRHSIFYRDLASPISANRAGGRSATPGQTAAVSALKQNNFSAEAADPPPPPIFTLDDPAHFPPSPGLAELSPAWPALDRVPPFASSSPFKTRVMEGGSGSCAANEGSNVARPQSWWSPIRMNGSVNHHDENGEGSPGLLITLPPQREVARPELQRNSLLAGGGIDQEEWVTIYGFSSADTISVLREFEKCGVILKHVLGPRDANWMHILYQNQYDAQNALRKDGMQINSVLSIGVKLVDPVQLQLLNESVRTNNHGGFRISLPPQSSTGRNSAARSPEGAFARPNCLLTSSTNGHRPIGAIASPSNSVASKVMGLVVWHMSSYFGIFCEGLTCFNC